MANIRQELRQQKLMIHHLMVQVLGDEALVDVPTEEQAAAAPVNETAATNSTETIASVASKPAAADDRNWSFH